MTEEQHAFASALVACHGWRWLPGMAAIAGGQLVRILGRSNGRIQAVGAAGWQEYLLSDFVKLSALPDLSDPVTAAAVLVVVREAWGSAQLPPPVDVAAARVLASTGATDADAEAFSGRAWIEHVNACCQSRGQRVD